MDVNIIFGPPGTGKTHRLMDILGTELKQYSPEEIAYVSFTREGAYQGRDRAIEEFGFEQSRFPYFRTLHSIAFSSLNYRRADVLSKKDYKNFSDKMGMNFTGYYTEDMRHDDDRFLFFADMHRNNPKVAKHYINQLPVDKLNFVQNNFRRFKKFMSKVDYTDMIMDFNKQNDAVPVKVAFIDEAQDLTTLQWRMIWTAFKNCERIYIAGDDDQAIYEWSGADVAYFLSIEGKMEILKHSYRVPNNLLPVPRRITSAISKRVNKEYDGIDSEGGLFYLNSHTEAPLSYTVDNGESWLILSRNNHFLSDVESWVRSLGLTYTRKGEPSVTHERIKMIKMFEAFRASRMISDEDQVILSPHLKSSYNLDRPWYDAFNWSMKDISYYRDVIATKSYVKDNKIKIGTIHSAKGDEADNVLLLSDITRTVYNHMSIAPDSEHRCFYVGVTRAKRNLFIVNPSSKFSYNLL